MAVRWMAAAMLVLVAPAAGSAQTFPGVYGRRLLISDHGSETQRRIVVKIVNSGLDVTAMNPPANGVFLHVYNSAGTSDSACMSLPAAGWKAVGSAFHYTDPTSANGPCRVAILKKASVFKAICTSKKSPITYTLDEAAQATVGVRLIAGPITYCADFGGAERGDVPGKKFLGKNAAAPGSCRPAPAVCPAS